MRVILALRTGLLDYKSNSRFAQIANFYTVGTALFWLIDPTFPPDCKSRYSICVGVSDPLHEAERAAIPTWGLPGNIPIDRALDEVRIEEDFARAISLFNPEVLSSSIDLIRAALDLRGNSMATSANRPRDEVAPEKLTDALREVAQVCLEATTIRLSGFQAKAHFDPDTNDPDTNDPDSDDGDSDDGDSGLSTWRASLCLAKLCSLVSQLRSPQLVLTGMNPQCVELLLFIRATLSALTRCEGY